MPELRKDRLTAQKVDTAVVFQRMGADDARAYMLAEKLPGSVIERILTGGTLRDGTQAARPEHANGADAPPAPVQPFYVSTGRRRDVVRAAIVEAALTVRERLDRDRAERLLRREALDDDVIGRVLDDEPAARRARRASA